MTEAAWTYHDILMDAVGDCPCHRYVAQIYGNKRKLADLRAWLEKDVRIVVNAPQNVLGPNGTVGVLILDAEETKST